MKHRLLSLLIALAVVFPSAAQEQTSFLGIFRYDDFPTFAMRLSPNLRSIPFEAWLIDIGGAGWIREKASAITAQVLEQYSARSGANHMPVDLFNQVYFFCQAENPSSAVCAAFCYAGLVDPYRFAGVFRLARSNAPGKVQLVKLSGKRGLDLRDRIGIAFSVVDGRATCIVMAAYGERWNQASLSVAGLGETSNCTLTPEFLHIPPPWGTDITLLTHPVDDGAEVYALIKGDAAEGYGELKLYRITDSTQLIPFRRSEKEVQISEGRKLPKNAEDPFGGFELMKMYRKLLRDPGAKEHKIRYPTREMGAALREYYKTLNDSEN